MATTASALRAIIAHLMAMPVTDDVTAREVRRTVDSLGARLDEETLPFRVIADNLTTDETLLMLDLRYELNADTLKPAFKSVFVDLQMKGLAYMDHESKDVVYLRLSDIGERVLEVLKSRI